jgi:hypothetical protein
MSLEPQLAATDPTQWIMLLLGGLALVFVVLRPSFRKRKDPLETRPLLSLSQQRQVEREMQNLLVELSEMSRQITAQLDTRSVKLEALIEEADRRIEALRRAAAQPSAARDLYNMEAGPEAPSGFPEPPARSAGDERYQDIYRLADGGRSAQEIAQELGRPRGEIELILALRR